MQRRETKPQSNFQVFGVLLSVIATLSMVPSQLGPAELQRVFYWVEIYFGDYVFVEIFLVFLLLLLLQLDDALRSWAIKNGFRLAWSKLEGAAPLVQWLASSKILMAVRSFCCIVLFIFLLLLFLLLSLLSLLLLLILLMLLLMMMMMMQMRNGKSKSKCNNGKKRKYQEKLQKAAKQHLLWIMFFPKQTTTNNPRKITLLFNFGETGAQCFFLRMYGKGCCDCNKTQPKQHANNKEAHHCRPRSCKRPCLIASGCDWCKSYVKVGNWKKPMYTDVSICI